MINPTKLPSQVNLAAGPTLLAKARAHNREVAAQLQKTEERMTESWANFDRDLVRGLRSYEIALKQNENLPETLFQAVA